MKPAFVRIAAASLLVVPLLVASQPAVAAQAPDELAAGVRRQLAAGVQVAPKQAGAAKLASAGVNPYLALVPDPTTVDDSAWNSVARTESSARAARMAAGLNKVATPPLIHDEAEPAGIFGANDTAETAELVKGLGTGRENVLTDLQDSAVNQRVGLRILNSRDHADPFGQPNVHRVMVGGTIAESGINTIGIAQFIDPGNYSTDDSALVLLDVLSNPSGAASLNTYITPASQKIKHRPGPGQRDQP
jgi:hypothetical protein